MPAPHKIGRTELVDYQTARMYARENSGLKRELFLKCLTEKGKKLYDGIVEFYGRPPKSWSISWQSMSLRWQVWSDDELVRLEVLRDWIADQMVCDVLPLVQSELPPENWHIGLGRNSPKRRYAKITMIG